MPERPIVNIDEAEWIVEAEQGTWGGDFKRLTPFLAQKRGALGMNVSRIRKGHTFCPFHYHMLEDEIFYVLSGRGVLRYGDEIYELRPGDCKVMVRGLDTVGVLTKTEYMRGESIERAKIFDLIDERPRG